MIAVIVIDQTQCYLSIYIYYICCLLLRMGHSMCALSRRATLRKFNNRTFQTEHMLTAVLILSFFGNRAYLRKRRTNSLFLLHLFSFQSYWQCYETSLENYKGFKLLISLKYIAAAYSLTALISCE